MKKFLSNPTVAMILAVLVVIGTMLISTKVDFGKKCAQTSGKFYARADAESPIADRLRDFCTAAEKIVLLGQRYGIDDTDDAYEKAEKKREKQQEKKLTPGKTFKRAVKR